MGSGGWPLGVYFVCGVVAFTGSAEVCSRKPNRVYLYVGNFGGILTTPADPVRDGQHAPFRLLGRVLHSLGIDCKRLTECDHEHIVPDDRVIYFDIPVFLDRIISSRTEVDVMFLWEPPPTLQLGNWTHPWKHRWFPRIYTLFDDFVDQQHYFKFYEYQPIFFEPRGLPIFEVRRFCTMISGNKRANLPRELYSWRVEFARTLLADSLENLDFWGIHYPRLNFGWCSTGEYENLRSVYKGRANSKIECYKNYKFAIIYENMRGRPGYLTAEKLLFPMMAGCVPIYWGADNVEEYVPRGCFIDRRDFSGDQELFNFIKSFGEGDYECFLERVESYMDSDSHLVFAPENLVDIIVNSIYPEYPREEVFDQAEVDKVYGAKRVMNRMGVLPPDEQKLWGLSS